MIVLSAFAKATADETESGLRLVAILMNNEQGTRNMEQGTIS